MLFKSAPLPFDRRPWSTALVSLLLAVHAVLAMVGIYGRSVTADETAHLTAGIAYWQFHDYRLQPENGNLPQRWGALPVLAEGARLDPVPQAAGWMVSNVWTVSQDFLFEHGRDADAYLFLGRCAMVVWSLANGLLIFFWSKSLWGVRGGLVSLAFYSFSPIALANAPLITSDMCAAFTLLASSYAGWKAFREPSARTFIASGLIFGLSCVAKFSAGLLLPTFVLIALGLSWNEAVARKWGDVGRRLLRVSGALAVMALIGGAVIWTFYGWRYAAVNAHAGLPEQLTFYLPWDTLDLGGFRPVIEVLQKWHIFPEPFLYGFSFVIHFSAGRGSFLAGEYGSGGWWWFFPFTFLVKSTIGELVLALAVAIRGLVAVMQRRASVCLQSSLLPLFAFAAVYGVTSILSHLNIGHRHILPLYLVFFIVAGGLLTKTVAVIWQRVVLAALVLGASETLWRAPNFLSFFNQLAGGPSRGWHLLVDSSLDWGQDVAPMAAWVRAHRQPKENVYVSSFGTMDPLYEGIPAKMLSPYFALGRPRQWLELEPGLYCISATMLQDPYGIKPGPWTDQLERDYQQLRGIVRARLSDKTFAREIPSAGFHPENPFWLLDRLRFARLCLYLRIRQPEAVINNSQFVFRLSATEVNIVTNRPFSELAELIRSAVHASGYESTPH